MICNELTKKSLWPSKELTGKKWTEHYFIHTIILLFSSFEECFGNQ